MEVMLQKALPDELFSKNWEEKTHQAKNKNKDIATNSRHSLHFIWLRNLELWKELLLTTRWPSLQATKDDCWLNS